MLWDGGACSWVEAGFRSQEGRQVERVLSVLPLWELVGGVLWTWELEEIWNITVQRGINQSEMFFIVQHEVPSCSSEAPMSTRTC